MAKTNFKHSRRKIMPALPAVSNSSSNFDRLAINAWSSKDVARQDKIFDKVYIDWGCEK